MFKYLDSPKSKVRHCVPTAFAKLAGQAQGGTSVAIFLAFGTECASLTGIHDRFDTASLLHQLLFLQQLRKSNQKEAAATKVLKRKKNDLFLGLFNCSLQGSTQMTSCHLPQE